MGRNYNKKQKTKKRYRCAREGEKLQTNRAVRREHLDVLDPARVAQRRLLLLPAAHAAEADQHAEQALGARHDVEGHRQRGLPADVLHVQLGPRVFPLSVRLGL